MASNEQTVTLLRANKRAQVDALNSLGFTLSETVRAADFPKYLKWGAGLLDVTVAAVRKSDGQKFYFTKEEWLDVLTESHRSLFLLRGVRVRALAHSWVIAPDTIPAKIWGPAIAVEDAYDINRKRDLYSFWDAYGETVKHYEYLKDKSDAAGVGAPAAEAALNYKAFTEEYDGLDDDSKWCIGTMAHWLAIYSFVDDINTVITAIWGSEYAISKKISYWTCMQYYNNGTLQYRFNFPSGENYCTTKAEPWAIRPICVED